MVVRERMRIFVVRRVRMVGSWILIIIILILFL